jgi:hypothetical protein
MYGNLHVPSILRELVAVSMGLELQVCSNFEDHKDVATICETITHIAHFFYPSICSHSISVFIASSMISLLGSSRNLTAK